VLLQVSSLRSWRRVSIVGLGLGEVNPTIKSLHERSGIENRRASKKSHTSHQGASSLYRWRRDQGVRNVELVRRIFS